MCVCVYIFLYNVWVIYFFGNSDDLELPLISYITNLKIQKKIKTSKLYNYIIFILFLWLKYRQV